MGTPLRKDDRRYTYADYLTWNDDQRWELIEGVAYAMAPAPTIQHQDIVGGIFSQAWFALKGKPCRALVAPVDVRLPKPKQNAERAETVVQPDVLAVCDAAKIDAKGVIGAPDWVVEVVSHASASRDNIVKRKVYEEAGVREYWLVYPEDRLVFIYRLAQGTYGKPDVQPLEGTTAVEVLPEVAIDWEPIVALLPPLEAS